MSKATGAVGVVLDCVVLLQSVVNEAGPAARVLDLLDEAKITAYVSRATLDEARYVLNRDELRARIPTIRDVAVDALFERLDQHAVLIKQVPKRFEYLRDPKDEPYINLALAAGATYIVSRDRDLLDLMRWDTEAGRAFRKRFRSLRVVTPEQLLDQLKA